MILAMQDESRARGGRGRRGFTLIELIVSLAVLGVGISVFVSMFGSSLNLSRTARDRMVAAALAEEQLSNILAHPDNYLWEISGGEPAGLFPIRLGADDPKAGNAVAEPAAMPTGQAPYGREKALYDGYKWRAFGRFPEEGAAYCEVMVVVLWDHDFAGRPRQSFSLTSAIPGPRGGLGGGRAPVAGEEQS